MGVFRWLVAAMALLVSSPASARAGTYEVWSCADPPRLVYDGTDGVMASSPGWLPIVAPGIVGGSNCSFGAPSTAKRIALETYGAISADGRAKYEFTAPAGALIEQVRVWRDIRLTTPGVRGGVFYGLEAGCSAPCSAGLGDSGVATGDPFAGARLAEYDVVYGGPFRIYLECGAGADCGAGGNTDYVRVYAARFTLSDNSAPVVTVPPTGSLLATGKPLADAHTFRVSGHDEGSGIAAFALEIDGAEVRRWPVASRQKPCTPPFADPQPCPSDVAAAYGFDTATLTDGRHSMRIKIIDAAGNEAQTEPVEVVTENRGTSCGPYGGVQIRARFARGSRRVARVRYGRGATLRGRVLDPGGQPIAGAPLQVMQTLMHSGAQPRVVGTLVSDALGRVRVQLAPGPSRTIRLGLPPGQGLGGLVCSPPVRLNVAAGVRFTVRPRRVSPNGRITFAGRLRGRPNRKGVQVAIYAVARRGRARVPVEILQTAARGRFRFAYRFRRSFAPFTYRFRARVPRQSSYPYARGWSRTVVVKVVR